MHTAQLTSSAELSEKPIDLSRESMAKLSAGGFTGTEPKAAEQTPRNVLRVTNAIAQYDVSPGNPQALSNIGKALAGCLDRDDITYYDPESRKEVKIGDVLVAVDMRNKDEIVLNHKETAGKGMLGRLLCSMDFINQNPLKTIAMKALGIVADPEVVYEQKVVQILSQLDREGLFGPPGASTFNLGDWEIDTRSAWRDVVIRRAPPAPTAPPDIGETVMNALKAPAT